MFLCWVVFWAGWVGHITYEVWTWRGSLPGARRIVLACLAGEILCVAAVAALA